MKVSPARRAAFEILRRVEEEAAYSSPLLAATDLNARDRALCHELVLGVLRNQLWLDRLIERFSARPIEKLDLAVTLALRLALYQLRFLTRIPQSAAVNESVNLVRSSRVKSAGPFVNAVLRRATREAKYDPVADVNDEIEKHAIETSHPLWLIERWSAQFGLEQAAAFARANNQPSPLAFRFTAKAAAGEERLIEDLKTSGIELIESGIAPGAFRLTRRHESIQKLVEEGLIYFQDEASQLVAHLVEAHDGDRVLDVCSAPGSKATLIAALSPMSFVVAGDLHEPRTRLVRDFAGRQHVKNLSVIRHDAAGGLPFPERAFDRVLVDAPCSGTGTMRHNPEIRWRLKVSDISDLAEKQKSILKNAAAVVGAGGRLVYSTCSVEKDENEHVVHKFLDDNPAFERARLNVPESLLTNDAAARTWPQRDDVEAFFVAAFQRKV